jgi:hypothetical protein
MCLLCVVDTDIAGDEIRRVHVLRLLALVEQPDALPHDVALRLSREILAIIGTAKVPFRCASVPSDGAIGKDP